MGVVGRPYRGRTMLHLTCEHCGGEFERRKGQESEHVFCSRDCYWKSDYRASLVAIQNTSRNPGAKFTAPCGTCGVEVTRYATRRAGAVYCSNECYAKARIVPQVTSSGYVRIFVGYGYPGATKTGHIMEHRKVMQDTLGRPLLPEENVHHINGVKTDNRPENLELWSTAQPQGQRVADKVRWAREFLAFYERQGAAQSTMAD